MINELFTALEAKTRNGSTAQIFKNSGMLNKYRELEYGFFPLGYGILSDDFHAGKTVLSTCKIMVLGNDFGTADYLADKCKDKREPPSNPTIKNLLGKLNLDTSSTFFTNFYLGVRLEGTNTKRAVCLEQDYKALCFDFFLTQLQIIDPQIVICLGHDVRKALARQSVLFSSWKGTSTTLKHLYAQKQHELNIADEQLGQRKFIVVPHPCDTRNFTTAYVDEILPSLQN